MTDDKPVIAELRTTKEKIAAIKADLDSRKGETIFVVDEDDEPTYEIRRFRFQGATETIATGLTLEEAQAHCNDPATHGEGWFDGYEAK